MWRRVRNCRRYVPGLLAKPAKAVVATPGLRVAMPQAAQRPAIVAQPARVASRLAPGLAAKVAELAAPTVALAANRAAPVVAIARPVADLHMVDVRKAKAIRLMAISHTAIKRMATRRTAMHRMATLPTATRLTATRAHTPRVVVHVRKARVAIVRKVQAGRRARAAIDRTAAVVPGRKVTAALLAADLQVAAVAAVVAIVQAIAEPDST